MSPDKGRDSTLSAAAEALELELERYDELVVGLERERLDSEKSLRRAAQMLTALADGETRLGEQLTTLVGAITTARERQQAHAQTVQTCAEHVRQRSEVLTALLQRFQALGDDAAAVTRLVQSTSNERRNPNGGTRGAESGMAFDEVDERLTRLADEAESLAQSAHAEHFAELARQGEGLRAQVLAARNKLRLARPQS